MARRDASHSYRIVVRGELGPRFAEVFDALAVDCGDGTSTLQGPVRDQAELNGILGLLDALGVEIVSIDDGGAGEAG